MLVLQSLSATAKGLVARQHVVQALMVETQKKLVTQRFKPHLNM